MDIKTKTIDLKPVDTYYVNAGMHPRGLVMKRNLTIDETIHIFVGILGFILPEEYIDEDDEIEYLSNLADDLSGFIEGRANPFTSELYSQLENNHITYVTFLEMVSCLQKLGVI